MLKIDSVTQNTRRAPRLSASSSAACAASPWR